MKIALCLSGLITKGKQGTTSYITGYQHLKNRILDNYDTDVFCHSYEPDMENIIFDMYKPKKIYFEKGKSFLERTRHFKKEYQNRSIQSYETIFSMFYSRKIALQLKQINELENSFRYDWVILARYDINSKYHIEPIVFDVRDKNNNKFCFAKFNQINAGFQDQWGYSSSENMDFIGKIYDELVYIFKPDSNYIKMVTTDWPISNKYDEFSCEIYKNEYIRAKETRPIKLDEIVNPHYVLKYYFLKNNMFNLNSFEEIDNRI